MLGQKMAQVPLDQSQMTKSEKAAKKLQDKAGKEIDGQARLRQLEAVGNKGQKRKNIDSSVSGPNKAQKPSSSASGGGDSEEEEDGGDNNLIAGKKGDAIYTGRGRLAKPRGGTNLLENYQGHLEYCDSDGSGNNFDEYNAEDYSSDKEYTGSGLEYGGQFSTNSSNSISGSSDDLSKNKSSCCGSRPETSRSRAPCRDNSLFGLGTFNLGEIAKQATALASRYPGSGMREKIYNPIYPFYFVLKIMLLLSRTH